MKDCLAFIRELPRRFSEIGAMVPSSRYLGKKMVRPIEQALHPLSILEVGPGTGPFTRQIIELMGADDHLVICELNRKFLNRLSQNLQSNSYYKQNKSRIDFFDGSVFDLGGRYQQGSFDVIVSSLPLANFSPEEVDRIFQLFDNLLVDGGSLTFFEYAGLKRIGAPFRSPV